MISEEITRYLIKVCKILNSNHVEYMVVGGAAVSHYGFNRPSGIGSYHSNLKADLDFWYKPTIENYEKIIQALDEMQIDTSDLKKLIFDKDHTFLKIPHKDFHTDFLPVIEGLDSFRISMSKAETVNIDGNSMRIISYDDLIANKKVVNRKTDQADIEQLQKFRRKKKKG
jgi:predicted nucleotidyltransferase